MKNATMVVGGGGTPIFFVHIPSNWIEIRLSTKNQVPMLPGSTIKVCVVVGWWWWGGGFHSIMWSHQLRSWVEVGL